MPGVRPIGIGETWRRLFAKIILLVAGGDATEACGIDQLCAGLMAGIEGGIHAMQHLWKQMKLEEDWGFLLIDARNAFNELNRTAMLWAVRHEWPSGARFAFNCYRHWGILVIRDFDGTCTLIFSQEGVTQGDPLAMILYGVATLPLIRLLKAEFTPQKLNQTWYADDGAAGANFSVLKHFLKRLEELGPQFGYFPEPSKSFLVVRTHNLESAKTAFAESGLNVVTGKRYLGGFIGEDADHLAWIQEKTRGWEHAVKALAMAARSYPQTAYCGLQRCLQQQWQYVQRVDKDIGGAFEGVRDAIYDIFLPALLDDAVPVDDPRRALAGLPVKFSGLALPDPSLTAETNYLASTLVTSHVVGALRGREPFRTADHLSVVSANKREINKRNIVKYDAALSRIVAKMSPAEKRTIMRAKVTGQFLTILPSNLKSTVLSCPELRDALHLHMARTPGDLPSHCDGCGKKCTVQHALGCKTGGLIHARHDEVKYELGAIAMLAFNESAVRDEPFIHHGRAVHSENANIPSTPPSNTEEIRGDILIRGCFARQTDLIVDIRVTDLDAASHQLKSPEKVLAQQEREKKKKYLKACLEQRRHFAPFVVSADGMKGKEAKALLQTLSARLATKWKKPYSQVCGYVNARMSIAIVRATHQCLRGSRVPASQMSYRRQQWEGGAGLSLFH